MKKKEYILECITPCFCAGAEWRQQAEIRVPSIRGQLRWWLRTLGGLKSLGMDARRQESDLFGNAAGDEGRASLVSFRIAPCNGKSLVSKTCKNADDMNAGMNTARGYVLFPLRKQRDNENRRGVFDAGSLPAFRLIVLFPARAERLGGPNLVSDINALVTVFGSLGALGFRSRRAFGALSFKESPPMSLKDALEHFNNSGAIVIKEMKASVNSADEAINSLANWLKGWRSHGRTQDRDRARPPNPPRNIGFKYAKNDHDVGAGRSSGETFRPAIGLPIIQRFSNGPTRHWGFETRDGRFASPVLLRPCRDSNGKWRALVVFVDAHRWPDQHTVSIEDRQYSVSLELYDAMKNDSGLRDFAV